jgi:uncharacterized membrane protein
MRILLAAISVFALGAVSGGASVHTVYTAPSVSHVEIQGPVLYSDADRRALRSVIRSELIRAKMARP